MQAYALALRARVVADREAGLPPVEVAHKYRVSPAWVRRLLQRYRESGQVAPKRRTQYRVPPWAPYLRPLAALIAAQPDATLAETALQTKMTRRYGRSHVARASWRKSPTAMGKRRRSLLRSAPPNSLLPPSSTAWSMARPLWRSVCRTGPRPPAPPGRRGRPGPSGLS